MCVFFIEGVRECVCMHVCVCASACVRACGTFHIKERERVCVREKESLPASESEWERVIELSERERERLCV